MPPRDRILTTLALLLVLLLTVSCNPNPQPEGLTPIPTLAPAATLTLIPSLEEPAAPSGGVVASPAPTAEAVASPPPTAEAVASPPPTAEAVASPAPTAEAVASPAPAAGDPANGATVFAQNCAGCHGPDAAGGAVGPTLISAELKAQNDDFFRQTILNGRSGTAMPAWQGRLSDQEIEDVIAFLRSKQ
jgi:mono/diheme cytochrome c family protein